MICGVPMPIPLLLTESQLEGRALHGAELSVFINSIRGVPSIKCVSIQGAALSPENTTRLRQSLPDVEIRHSP